MIKKHWTSKKLGTLCEILLGRTPSRNNKAYWGKGTSWVSISDLKERFIGDTKEEITALGAKESRSRLIPKDTLLMSFKLSVGKLAFTKKELYTNEAIAALPIKNPLELDKYFLYYALKNIPLIGGNQAVMGQTLNKTSLTNLKIPYPKNLENQKRIAQVLTDCETLIAQRKESIALLDELLKSTFLEMFGDPVKNEKEFEMVPFQLLGTINRGISKFRPRNAPELLGGNHPLIQTGDVSNSGTYITEYKQTYSDLGLSQSKKWPVGTLCITIAANIAKTGILTFEACFPDSVVGFIVNKESNNLYVHFLFSFFQRILEKNAPSAAQKNINLGILRNLKVPKPPIGLQDEFAQIVEKVEETKNLYKSHLSELENLYGRLSQDAFKGGLDLSKVILTKSNLYLEKDDNKAEPETISDPQTKHNQTPIDVEFIIENILNKDFNNKVFSVLDILKQTKNQQTNITGSLIRSSLKDYIKNDKIEQVYDENLKEILFKLKK